ncbi:MAG TPA: hypothetical protein VHU89_00015 [Acidobacteriaceae bacterium]|jgi:hypothetical protein|nr:hypothetical protein [Acidobacteriaceae bacterium]
MRSQKVSARTVDRLKDEVYRQMLRLEGGRPSAHARLAVALLNAWLTLEKQPLDGEPRQWLRELSPVCLRMIEDACRDVCGSALQAGPAGSTRRSSEPATPR